MEKVISICKVIAGIEKVAIIGLTIFVVGVCLTYGYYMVTGKLEGGKN